MPHPWAASHEQACLPATHPAARAPRQVTPDGVIYSKRTGSLTQLMNDDELAAEEAAAQGGVPGYCGDRMLTALAGGQSNCEAAERAAAARRAQ